MKVFSSKRRVAMVAVLVLLVLFLLRPGASRLKSRIILSISSAVGRPVDIGSVHLRFLPRPGFDLENLVVYDDPAFGAEPILRASEVTALLRLTSLARGRIEIARLDLSEPSLNLVHRPGGGWNLEAMLERAAHTPLAPTGKAKSGPRPAFPYIEGSSARINFKNGPEKKPYALTNADFSLWQDSENTWGVRLKAQPFRSDLNLNDIGVLQASGTWQRANTFGDTPVQINAQWERAQLGQVTKFVSGDDLGWRGAVEIDLTVSGTPANLQIASSALVQDFRRYDVNRGEPLRLGVRCGARYSSHEHIFRGIDCAAPVGKGLLTLQGQAGIPGSHNYDLALTIENVPASSAVALAEHARKNLPDDLVAAGTAEGSFSIARDADTGQARIEGQGEVADLQLTSAANKTEFGPQTIPFVLTDTPPGAATKGSVRRQNIAGIPEGPRIEIGPFPVSTGHAVAPTLRGWLNRGGYSISLAGEADVDKMLRAARLAGVPALQANVEGTAQLDLQIAGSWPWSSSTANAVAPEAKLTGTAKLHNVRAAVRGTATPVQILSAELQLAPDHVRVDKLNARTAETAWTGSLDFPRGCGSSGDCEVHFDLNAGQIALVELSEWLNPRQKQRPWYRVLESSTATGPSFLSSLRASGHVNIDRLQLKSVAASRVSASVSLENGKAKFADLTADFLGGKHRGEWRADFSVKPGVCSGSGSLNGVSLAQLADTMKDRWIAGTARATYEVKGECPTDFWAGAEGMLAFDVRDGGLPHVTLTGEDVPVKFTEISGRARLHGGKLELKDGQVDSTNGRFQLSGTATLNRVLELKMAPLANGPGEGYEITGTVAEPRVKPLSEAEQARLKSEPTK